MRLAVARIGRPHGIKGEVTIEALTDRPEERFVAGNTLECDSPLHQALEISRVRVHQGVLGLILFKSLAVTLVRGVGGFAWEFFFKATEQPISFHIAKLRNLAHLCENS